MTAANGDKRDAQLIAAHLEVPRFDSIGTDLDHHVFHGAPMLSRPLGHALAAVWPLDRRACLWIIKRPPEPHIAKPLARVNQGTGNRIRNVVAAAPSVV